MFPTRAALPVRFTRNAAAAALLLFLAACGGGSGGTGEADGGPTGSPAAAGPSNAPLAAARFLTQATYGPTSAEITRLSTMTYSAWIDEQFAKPQSLHRQYMDQAAGDQAAMNAQVNQDNFFNSYWSQAIGGSDQLRQRAAFALSQIFVISFTDTALRSQARGVA